MVKVPNEARQDEIMEIAKQDKLISEYLNGKEIVKVIFVKGRIFNVVVK